MFFSTPWLAQPWHWTKTSNGDFDVSLMFIPWVESRSKNSDHQNPKFLNQSSLQNQFFRCTSPTYPNSMVSMSQSTGELVVWVSVVWIPALPLWKEKPRSKKSQTTGSQSTNFPFGDSSFELTDWPIKFTDLAISATWPCKETPWKVDFYRAAVEHVFFNGSSFKALYIAA